MSSIEDPTAAPERTEPHRFAPVLLVLGSMVSLQFGAATAKALFPTVGAAGASALRLGLSAVILVLLPVTRPRRPRSWDRAQWTSVILLGLTMAAMNSAFYVAVERLPLGIAITIEFLGPLGVATALSRRWRDGLWVLLALGGVGLLSLGDVHGGEALDRVGVAFALVAGAGWAAYIGAASRIGVTGPTRGGLAGASVVAGVLTLPLGVASAGTDLLSPRVLGLGLVVAVLASVVPYSFELQALRTLPKQAFSILVALEPAVGAVVGFALLDQALGRWSIAAIVMVIVAGIGATVTARQAPRAEAGLGG
ncbi:MAG: putative transporter protein permease component [Acidimicrobiales bacterium]|nr:putative transporter protein permease component [Acidimicrobiales bacterium]